MSESPTQTQQQSQIKHLQSWLSAIYDTAQRYIKNSNGISCVDTPNRC